MAEFCKQCADELEFNPENDIEYDFVGLQTDEKWDAMPENYGLLVLCEGCGPIIVDRDGKCISTTCKLHGDSSGG